MSFTQKILVLLGIPSGDLEYRNIFEGEGDRFALSLFGLDDNSLFMLNCDGVDGATNFKDLSANESSISVIGGAEKDTAIKKYGSASLLVGPADYIETGDRAAYNVGAGDWTYEAFISTSDVSLSARCALQKGKTTNFGIYIGRDADGTPFALAGVNGGGWSTPLAGSTVLTDGAMRHVALVRYGTALDLYIDGISEASIVLGAGDILNTGSAGFRLGASNLPATQDWRGNIDEPRFSDVARYTGNFTPPTQGWSYSTASPSPVAVWTAMPVGAEVDMSTAKCWMFKDGVVQAATNTDVKFKYAANNGALSSSLTLAALRLEANPTISDIVNSFEAVGVYASDGTYESMSSAWLEVDVIYPENGGGGDGRRPRIRRHGV